MLLDIFSNQANVRNWEEAELNSSKMLFQVILFEIEKNPNFEFLSKLFELGILKKILTKFDSLSNETVRKIVDTKHKTVTSDLSCNLVSVEPNEKSKEI